MMLVAGTLRSVAGALRTPFLVTFRGLFRS